MSQPLLAWYSNSRFRLAAALVALALFSSGCSVGTTIVSDTAQTEHQAANPDADQPETGQPGTAQSETSQLENGQPDSTDQTAEAASGTERGAMGQDTATPALDDSTGDGVAELQVGDFDCDSGLTGPGLTMWNDHVDDDPVIPVYDIDAMIDPLAGRVSATMRAWLPGTDETVHFRVYPGMSAFDAGLDISEVTLDGQPVDAYVDHALLTVETGRATDSPRQIAMSFEYQVAQMAANESILGSLTGDTLQPDQVGLLGRTETGMQLGHWFPVWLPGGTRTDPDPSGYGDIGAFPAAAICATVDVPDDYTVITSGVANPGREGTESATGIRDYSLLISNEIEMVKGTVEGVEVRVWGPADDPSALQQVLEYSLVSQQALHDAFGPYPWTEIDVVSAPLGGGVGGMEWPGMVWVERSMFAGGLPGMGGLGGLGDLFGGDDSPLGDMLGSVGGDAITTTLEWTIAHELGHEWFHAMVGNDSIAAPAVDEPLAQFAACVAMREIHPDNWLPICQAQTIDQFAMARGMGIPDAAADQASDEFSSAMQYGAVVYGKAPGFYFEAADVLGWDGLEASLASFVEAHAFTMVGTDVLRQHLVAAAGPDGDTIEALWQRWFSEALGDADIESTSPFGDIFGEDMNLDDLFGGLGENGELNLDDLFEGLGENGELNLDDLFEGLGENGELNLEDLFGDLFGADN